MTMKRKRLLLLIGFFLLAVVAASVVHLNWRHQARLQVLNETFAKIEIGMSRAEAAGLIGRPPDYVGDYGETVNRIGECRYIEGYRLDLELTRDTQVVIKKDLSPLYQPGPLDWLKRLFYGGI
jgi:hypothetical protein